MDAEKITSMRTRLNLALLDAKNIELKDLNEGDKVAYLSAVLTDILGELYALFTVLYNQDIDKAIGLVHLELRKSIVDNYNQMVKISKSDIDSG